MKKIITLAIMCLMTVNVVAMERELMPGSEKPFLVRADDLEHINSLPNNFTITSEELQEVGDVLPDAPQWEIESESRRLTESELFEIEHENFFLGEDQRDDDNKKELYTCHLQHNPKQPLWSLQFKSQNILRTHEYEKHNIKTYVCMKLVIDKKNDTNSVPEVCLERFLKRQELDDHRTKHTYGCHICWCKGQKNLEQWPSIKNLWYHFHNRADHCGWGQKNACLLCDPVKPLRTESDLYLHLKEEHDLLNWP